MKKALLFIILLAAFLRLYKLGEIPNGLYQDETAIGYNAYSMLKTGRDEHGIKFPLYFKSFGDYKLPVYIYLTTASVKLFGLSEFAVRLPSAFFGTLTVPLMYFLVYSLFKKTNIALLSSLLLAINPWHLHYSRATFEVTLALFFFLLGALILPRKVLLGTVCFIIAFYSYNLTRLLAPLLYILTLRSHNIKPKPFVYAVILVLLLPFFITLFTGGGTKSATGTFIFTSGNTQAPLLEIRSYMLSLPFSKLYFNQMISTLWLYLQNIVRFLSVEFFFLTGSPHGNHGIGNMGQFYLFELPFIFLGFRMHPLLFGWMLITILVASLTREAPHATRSFFLLFPIIIFSASGLIKILRTRYKYLLFAIILYNLIYYFSSYYFRFPVFYAKQWRAADKEVALFLKDVENQYDRIIIDKESGLVYSSLLFYQQRIQESIQRAPDDSEGFSEVLSFGKYEFRQIQESDLSNPNALIITTPDSHQNAIRTFFYPERPVVISVKEQIAQYPVRESAYIAIESKQ